MLTFFPTPSFIEAFLKKFIQMLISPEYFLTCPTAGGNKEGWHGAFNLPLMHIFPAVQTMVVPVGTHIVPPTCAKLHSWDLLHPLLNPWVPSCHNVKGQISKALTLQIVAIIEATEMWNAPFSTSSALFVIRYTGFNYSCVNTVYRKEMLVLKSKRKGAISDNLWQSFQEKNPTTLCNSFQS